MRSFDQQHQPSQPLNSDALVSEYLMMAARPSLPLAPRTFHMDALFNELKQIDSASTGGVAAASSSASSNVFGEVAASTAADWSQEYWTSVIQQKQKPQQPPLIMDSSAFKWSADYLAQNEATILDEAWMEGMFNKSSNNNNQVHLATSAGVAQQQQQNGPTIAGGLNKSSDNIIEANKLNEEMLKTANELLDSMQDSRFSETEFLSFVRELSQNAAAMSAASSADSKAKASATSVAVAESTGDLAHEWVSEFSSNAAGANLRADEGFEQRYWNDLQDEWNNMAGYISISNEKQSLFWTS
jgi:hypothetical protein